MVVIFPNDIRTISLFLIKLKYHVIHAYNLNMRALAACNLELLVKHNSPLNVPCTFGDLVFNNSIYLLKGEEVFLLIEEAHWGSIGEHQVLVSFSVLRELSLNALEEIDLLEGSDG